MRHLTHDLGHERPKDTRAWVVHQSIDYLSEVSYPGVVVVGIGVSRIGTSSWSVAMGLFAEGRCAGLSTAVLVHGLDTGPAPIPESQRALLQRFMLPADSLTPS